MCDFDLFFSKYDVSRSGVVEVLSTGRVLLQQTTKKGYKRVCCHINGKIINYKVARVVAYKYIPNPDKLPEVNHKDGVKSNNHWSNLEWCTGEENRKHAKESRLVPFGESHSRAKLCDADVLTIRSRVNGGETFKKVYENYKDKVGWWTFRDICRGKSWRHLL